MKLWSSYASYFCLSFGRHLSIFSLLFSWDPAAPQFKLEGNLVAPQFKLEGNLVVGQSYVHIYIDINNIFKALVATHVMHHFSASRYMSLRGASRYSASRFTYVVSL